MARALELLLLDLLLDEVLSGGDGGGGAADGDDPVAGARGERPLLRDLDVGARHLLDFHQTATTWACGLQAMFRHLNVYRQRNYVRNSYQ